MKHICTCILSIIISCLVLPGCHSKSIKTNQQFLDLSSVDSSVKPGDNFYLYSNGLWLKKAVIPPTQSSTGATYDLYNSTKVELHNILDSVSKGNFDKGSIAQQVGDFYASGMDSASIEKLGYEPVKSLLSQINSIKTYKDVLQFAVQEEKEEQDNLFGITIQPDEKNSSINIVAVSQAGLGLPDRDYYFKKDAATLKVVKAYKNYITKIFQLTGDDSITAVRKTLNIFNLETQMASSHRTNVELRDPQKNYNKKALQEIDKEMPAIGWINLFKNLGFKTDSLDLQQPAYYSKLNNLLSSEPINTWKDYLSFHLLSSAAPALSSDFVNARFSYIKTLTGQQQLTPRWERIYNSTDNHLGYALGKLYADKYFTSDAKQRMLDLVNNLQKAFETRINNLDWMSDSTKKIAVDKLHDFIKKIGYPDKWRTYNVFIDRNKYYENIIACDKEDYLYQLNKLGKPVDKTEWGITPPTINAYYNPSFNEIVFPAGILQPPFFNPNADDAVNYGAIGMIIGHEMTHGFDDQGAQYDKDGNLKNWWSNSDSVKFHGKTKQIIAQYNSFTILDSVHINGALTTGENIADLGGLNIAYDAFKLTKQGKDTTKIDGLTPDQRFFLSLAQSWHEKLSDETARYLVNDDVHSPAMYRVNGPLENFEPFYKAFNVQPGDKMYLADSLKNKIW